MEVKLIQYGFTRNGRIQRKKIANYLNRYCIDDYTLWHFYLSALLAG